jgi:hypothetical protein
LRDYTIALVFIIIVATLIPTVQSVPSGGTMPPHFIHRSGYWYDDWGITRDDAEGKNGYLPSLYLETVGSNAEKAWDIGIFLATKYPDLTSRASAILAYVQRWTEYGYDDENVVMGGNAQQEWAWNADEMADSFDETKGIVAIGDCEDMAFLCATIYSAAGYDTAVVDAPSHVALLIWLPGFPNANYYWDLDDGRGAGWVWVEATGDSNPVGWTPSDFFNGYWSAYSYQNGTFHEFYPAEPVSDSDGFTIEFDTLELIGFIMLIIVISRLRRL